MARYTKFCLFLYAACSLLCVGATLLIKFSKEASAEGLGRRMFEVLQGGQGGGMAKRRGTVVNSTTEERRAVLRKKLQMRRAMASPK